MLIDDVSKHIGEERVSGRGSYNSSLPQNQRIRIEAIERVRTGRQYNWRTREYKDRMGRRVRVTALDRDTGEPRQFMDKDESHLIEAKQIGELWTDWWAATQADREHRDRVTSARDRLRRHLGDEHSVTSRWAGDGINLSVDAAEALLDMLGEPGADEEG